MASIFGRLTLITGPEQYLAERELARRVAQARAQTPESHVAAAAAADLTPALLDQMTGTDLFSSATIACITEAEKTPKTIEPLLIELAGKVPDNLALLISHAGGREGKALLDRLSSLATIVIPHPILKPKDIPGFVTAEVHERGWTITASAAQCLIDSVGQDTRALVAAISQLLADSDSDSGAVSQAMVNRYFAGLARVTQYAVADDAVAGRVGEAIVKLRWSLSTGVSHTQITSALAGSLRQIGTYLSLSGQRQPLPDEIGIPSWKMKTFVPMARAWSPKAIAAAIRSVSQADAQVKGAAQDPDYALERLIIRLASLRRTA